MTAAEKAYTAEYSYVAPSVYARELAQQFPERQKNVPGTNGGRKRRTAEEIKVIPGTKQQAHISGAFLRRWVFILVIAGILLVGTVWMSAKATSVKCAINKTNSEIRVLENDINPLNLKIQSANSIESVEEYAISNLGMRYPKSNQCIYIESGDEVRDDLAEVIRQKAYK